MTKEYYNPSNDRYYRDNYNEEISPQAQQVIDEGNIRRELASKENHERLVRQQISAREEYEDQYRQIQRNREFKRQQEEEERRTRIAEREKFDQEIKKEAAIDRAKERYASKSVFYRMFHKNIDCFKTGIGYHNTADMSIEEIDNLYAGGKGK